jgi:hypothetical protein
VIQLYEKDNLVKRINASNDTDKVKLMKILFSYKINFHSEFLGISRCSECD